MSLAILLAWETRRYDTQRVGNSGRKSEVKSNRYCISEVVTFYLKHKRFTGLPNSWNPLTSTSLIVVVDINSFEKQFCFTSKLINKFVAEISVINLYFKSLEYIQQKLFVGGI